MFRRKIYDDLKAWKDRKGGRYALMVEGARRVGKSTIVEEFVRNEYESYILVKFERVGDEIRDLFQRMDDLDRFFLHLQQYAGVRLHERRSAIVFDEVQLFPLARQAIKVLVEDGRYDYYETGSLISIKKNVRNILIPSEEDTIHMFPMDFEEFLWARGDTVTMPMVRRAFETLEPLGRDMHDRIMEQYRTYMLVGGMPQAVQRLVDDNSFSSVEDAKASILDLYMKDAVKLDGPHGVKASAIFRSLASNLEKHDRTFSPGSVRKGTGIRDYRKAIDDLGESMMVNLCHRVTEPAVDQASHYDEDDLKVYMCDTGLLFTQSFTTMRYDADGVYGSILRGDLNINQGMYFENMVAQELRATGHGLYFSKFPHRDSDRLQEVDFVIVRRREPVPVEVKSGQKSKAHKSLDRFMDKYGDVTGSPFVVHTKDLERVGGITYIPIYMASLL
ncbi:MAG: ATP-binding protein [Candidatus Methanomethylophilaceae archaeon]|nr:ATP-binding protein [Candidatus Methanomethylophilaceae archaeon]